MSSHNFGPEFDKNFHRTHQVTIGYMKGDKLLRDYAGLLKSKKPIDKEKFLENMQIPIEEREERKKDLEAMENINFIFFAKRL